jgi:hypothetical protein
VSSGAVWSGEERRGKEKVREREIENATATNSPSVHIGGPRYITLVQNCIGGSAVAGSDKGFRHSRVLRMRYTNSVAFSPQANYTH